MNKLLIAMLGMALAGAAGAKLPAPSPDAQAKAEEAKQKTAWSDKVAAYQLCKAQDRVAAEYRQKKGSQPAAAPAAPAAAAPAAAEPAATPAVAAPAPAPTIPPCQDPGPYVAASEAAKVGVADSLPVPAAGKPATPAEAKK
jgi:sRNA-binding protein